MIYFTFLIVFAALATCSAQTVSCGGHPITVCEYEMFFIVLYTILHYLYFILYLSS